MKVSVATLEQRPFVDLLVLPFWEGGKEASSLGSLKKEIDPVLKLGDFKGKQGELELLYGKGESRLLLLGLGSQEESSSESLRRSAAAAVRWAKGKKLKKVAFLMPSKFAPFCEAIFLSNYSFSFQEKKPFLLEEVVLVGLKKEDQFSLKKLETMKEAIFLVRDLVNGNADDVTPKMVAEMAKSLSKKWPSLKLTIWDKKKLEAEKMGLILAVSRGSSVDPCLVQLSYKGNPSSKDHIVLIGKGITYDTGGLSLKPTEGMLTMKCDMAGAATVLGALQMAAALKLKVNVTALAPLAENAIDANSYKPGDVYRSYSGKTVEINNTDAEGRLVLADAISYAIQNLKPSCIVDLATLTGAIVIALGEEMAGFFTKDQKLAKELLDASESSGELLWQMPMHADYAESLKSDIADIIHTGGREAGSIKAALFLQEFAGKIPFAHIDFAGPVFLTKPKHYNPTKATGYGVRLLTAFLEQRSR